MSLIYEHENQMIVRFPKDIALKIKDSMNQGIVHQMKIQPFTDTASVQVQSNFEAETPKIQKSSTQIKFEVSIPAFNFNAVGNLIDLPTISESYKSKDYINLYKSNDINQMIWIEGKNPEEKMAGVRKIHEQPNQVGQNHQTKLIADSGLTPQTYDIRRDCHRKQPLIQEDDVRRIENELDEIQKQFMQQFQNQDLDESGQDIGDSRSILEKDKKKQRKRYNKF